MITHDYKGRSFFFRESPIAQVLIQEIFNDNYKIFQREVPIAPGDIILDIGANEGMFSIMMAKLYPDVEVLAFEPVPDIYHLMLENIDLNAVKNIKTFCMGIGAIKKGIINYNPQFSGGASLMETYDPAIHKQVTVDLIPFDAIFNDYLPVGRRVKLLKIDIEGGEYDALYNSRRLDRVDFVVGEFHTNKRLAERNLDINELGTWVGSQTNLLYYEKMKMGE